MPLRHPRLDDALRDRIARHLAAFPRRALPAEGRRPAAVAAVLLPGPAGEPCFALTRRAAHLSSHGGQWALPGGRLEPGEGPVEAALRELAEEVGLPLGREAVLGLLDDYATRSGYRITPVVLFAPRAGPLRPDPGEVAGAWRVPVSDLDAPGAREGGPAAEGASPLLRIRLASLGATVHAPTAAILHQLAEVAFRGRATRVDGVEEPRFAWR